MYRLEGHGCKNRFVSVAGGQQETGCPLTMPRAELLKDKAITVKGASWEIELWEVMSEGWPALGPGQGREGAGKCGLKEDSQGLDTE